MAHRPENPNLLIVEGHDDRMSVIGLMEHHVRWPNGKEHAPVFIDLGLSADEILNAKYLSTQVKTPGLKRLGIMFDADSKPRSRYVSLRTMCLRYFPNLPEEMPDAGVIVDHEGIRFGTWIMPDNKSEGDLETFLRYLVPTDCEATWKHAEESVGRARSMGAKCKDSHVTKANLYTWLAWQDEPGQSPGRSLTRKVLDPTGKRAAKFIKWFSDLYELDLTNTESTGAAEVR